jgi:tail lysozyme
MANNVDRIVQFFTSKGLSKTAIAGILGNLQVESGFNPGAQNANEGAIGIGQWEGGRRTALQAFARAHGTSETDLNAQLGYMWQELSGSYSGALGALRGATSAAQAATIWDSQYEVSAGTTRGQRISNAETFAANGLKGGGPSSASGGITPDMLGSSPGGEAKNTKADYTQALNDMAGILIGVPELKKLLDQAIAQNMPVADFQNEIQNSKWYKTHNDATKRLFALRFSDPAEYKTQLTQAGSTVQTLAAQMGVTLHGTEQADLARKYIEGGWDQATLQRALGADINFKNGDRSPLTGGYAQAYDQLKQNFAAYGVPVSDLTLRYRAREMVSGIQTLDTYKQLALSSAKSMYPSLAGQLDSGLTVKDIADPYIQQMGNLLEIDPQTIDITDPTIKRALQGSVVNTGGKSTATSTPLYQFEQTLRADPRWAKTQNATDTMSTSLVHIGRDFGFGGF